jgi:alanine-glyoxylate transaminase/serine-glyoxylate transaminase/serine-pyruvate transaminase
MTGAVVHQIEKPAGKTFNKAEIATALQTHRPKVLFLVHSESSTGVMQNLEGIGELCERYILHL